ncbi:MAG TPA: two-component regulator propeller domain-containing protein [Mucilaginibacter sp.]|nr:two-component regulator propeller domain-containing protein [Mucilaginibacter sp.]
MRPFVAILLLSLSVKVWAVSPVTLLPDSDKNVVVDYPQVLQKAGIKKVHCIFKDSRKFIWIGTENGLYRYDGTNLDLLQHDAANPHSLPQNTVVNITEDHSGHIWAGTLEGAARVNPWTFACSTYNRRRHNLGQDFDIKIFVDRQGKIWACGSHGLDLYDPRKDAFRKVWQHDDKSGAGYINCLTDWKKDTLAFGTFDGAVLIDKNNFGYRRLLGGTDITVTRVFADENNRLWLGTWANGCMIFPPDGGRFQNLSFETKRSGILTNVITGIVETRYNNDKVMWIATLNGVYKMKADGWPLKGAATLVWPGIVNNIMADDEQYIWEAGGAMSRFYAGSRFFKTVPIDYSGTVQDILRVTIKQKQYLATLTWYASSGLVISDMAGNTIYKQPRQVNENASNIGALARDKYGRLWISSLAGVGVFNDSFNEIYDFAKAPPADRLSSTKTNHLVISRDTVWIACYKKGVDLYDLNFHKLKTFLPGDRSGLADDFIQRLFADSRGNIWLLGNSNLYKYQGAANKLRKFNFNRDSTAFSVNCMAELTNGDLLIASGSGLFRLNPKTYSYQKITSPLIDNNNIIAVAADADDNIWFINSEHLIWYQPKTNHFTLFGQEDGLNTDDDLQWLSFLGNKKLGLAANKQIVTFTPDKNERRTLPARLYFHDIEVNDSTMARGIAGGPLKLKYNENRLNIGLGVINYIKPEQNLYAYRLSSVDDKWIYTSHNFAAYANLAPGNYTLKYKAANYAGVWSQPISMDITVYPPFWATWWFRLLSIAVVGSILFVSVRYVLQRNLRERILKLEKEQAVEKERNRIARDMHDDLGSGLTKIAILSEVAKTQVGGAVKASSNLDVISNASRELVDNLQDIIWVLNPRNDSLSSLVLYIKEYTEGFFEPAGLQCEFAYCNTDKPIKLSEEQRRNIFLAVKESCNNILKHAACTSVRISLKLEHNRLVISVKDDGRGFDVAGVGVFSNGLQNIRNRMEQIGAACRIVSEKNSGTAITLTIPV